MGMWLSGRAFALHVKGPGFDPRHLHDFSDFFGYIITWKKGERGEIVFFAIHKPRKSVSTRP